MGVASVGDCLYLDLNSRQLSTAIDNCRQLPSTFIYRQKCPLSVVYHRQLLSTVDDFRQLPTTLVNSKRLSSIVVNFADHSLRLSLTFVNYR